VHPVTAGPSKRQWRTQLLAARRRVPAALRAAEAVALAAGAGALVEPGAVLCGYLPVGTEPGSAALLDQLLRRGVRVLLPVAREDAALSWADYRGESQLRTAPFGLREPTGPVLEPATVTLADVVLVPALAVDLDGRRLGRGGGFYDRTLGLLGSGTPVVAVVRDDELVNTLPAEPHDVPVGWALTPQGGLVALGGQCPAQV